MWLKSSWEVLMIEKKTKLQTFQNNPRSQDFTDFSNLSLKKWRILCRWKLCQNEMDMVLMVVQSLVELDNEDWILISKGENFHSVEKLNIRSPHWKKMSWNQLFSKSVAFTKFLPKKRERKFP